MKRFQLRRTAATVAALAVVFTATSTAASIATGHGSAGAQTPVGADPEQVIDRDQIVTDDGAVIADGHVDLGPVLVDGEWQLRIHDDSQEPSAWRSAHNTVLHVSDAALVEVPDDPNYEFLGVSAGQSVYVVGQTQSPGVVWIGWNTQAPSVLDQIDRGITLRLRRVEGPGTATVYLQSGNFAAPQPLWQSGLLADGGPQSLWVDMNTHSHANWVFTEPGVYLLDLEVVATLIDGSEIATSATVRVAVGDATDPAAAVSAQFEAAPASTSDGSDMTSVDTSGGDTAHSGDESGDSSGLIRTLGTLAVAAATLGALVVIRSRRSGLRSDLRAGRRAGRR